MSSPSLPLVPALRGYIKYIVAMDEQAMQVYSIGIRFLLPTAGAEKLLKRLQAQKYKENKASMGGVLCPSVTSGEPCLAGEDCSKLHVHPDGYSQRREWKKPVRKIIKPSGKQADDLAAFPGPHPDAGRAPVA